MTEPLDVSLRVRLAYEAGGSAKAAVGDIEAIRAGAQKLGAGGGVSAVARDLGALHKAAEMAKTGLTGLAAAGDRLGGAATAGQRLTGELRGIATAADGAAQRLAAAGKVDWGPRRGAAQDWAAYWRERGGAAAATGKVRAADWAAAGAPDRSAAVAAAKAHTEALAASAAKLGTAAGPKHLGEAVATVSTAAVEARRELDNVGSSAVKAARDLERLDRAERAGGGGSGGSGGGGQGGGRHGAGGGGLRGALMAGARPLHMERLVMSAMTPIGAAGLGVGYGALKAYEAMHGAVKDAIDLETAMAEVKRSVGDMPAGGVKALETSILSTSRATGVATGELAKLTAMGAAAGRPAAELPAFMELSAKVAGGFGMKAEEAAETLTRIGSASGSDQKGLQNTADTAAALQERTGASGGNTLDFAARTGEIGKLGGMRPEQLAAYGATFQKQGMGAAEGSAVFTSLLEKLQSAPQQGNEFQLGLSRMGTTDGTPEGAYALRNAARSDASGAILRMLGDIKRLDPAERQSVLTRMFGEEDGARLARMSEHLGELKQNLKLVDDTAARSGAVERVFRVFDETTSAKIDKATAAIGAFSVKVGQSFAPAIGAAAEATAKFFGGWLDRMDAMERAGAIVDKITKGVALSPDDQKKLDADPKFKAQVEGGVDAAGVAKRNDAERTPDPEVGRRREMERMRPPASPEASDTSAREQDRLGRAEAIRQLEDWAKKHGDATVGDDLGEQRRAYRHDFPEAPPPASARAPELLPAEALRERLARPGAPPPSAAPTSHDAQPAEALREKPARPDAPPPPPAPTPPAAPDDDSLIAMPMRYEGSGAAPLLRRTSLGGDDRAPGGSPSEALQAVIEAGTKAGVVAGLREVADMRGGAGAASGGLVNASWEDGDTGRSVGGAAGAAPRRSLRYGGGFGPRGRQDPDGSSHHRSLRYGRGYGPVHDGGGGGAGAHAGRHGRPGSDAVPDASYQTKGNRIDGLSDDGTRQYAAVLGKRESGNRYGTTNPYGYVGRWQMGADALAENGYVKRGTTNRGLNDPSAWTGKGDVHSVEEFKANKGGVQDREFAEYTNRHYAQLKRAGVVKDGMGQADVAGWLAAAHLKGVGGAIALSRGHDNVDANGTSASSYRRMMAGVGSGKASPGLAPRDGPVAVDEDRATRARRSITPPAHPLSPRFADPGKLKVRPQPGDVTADAGGRRQVAAAGPSVVQHFHGNHDPVQTAHYAQLESNREIRRTLARANHGIGRVS